MIRFRIEALLFPIMFMVTTSFAQLPSDSEMFKEFNPFDGKFLYSTLMNLPKTERDRYFSLSRDELERQCATVVWTGGGHGFLGKRLFIAATPHPDIQAKLAAHWLARGWPSPDSLIQFYSDTPDRYFQWIAEISKLIIREEPPIGRDVEFLTILLAVDAASAPGLSEVERERAIWSVLHRRAIEENELPQLRAKPGVLLDRLSGATRPTRDIISKFGRYLPKETWNKVWHSGKDNLLPVYGFPCYLSIAILSGEIDLEEFTKDKETYDQTLDRLYNDWRLCNSYDLRRGLMLIIDAESVP